MDIGEVEAVGGDGEAGLGAVLGLEVFFFLT